MTWTTDNRALVQAPADLAAREFEIAVRRMAQDLSYGTDASRFFGSGTEYAQTRQFSWGDQVRSIDWRVTARTGKVHVKEYEATKRVPMFVIVDTSASMALSSTAVSKHDVAVWAASVLALVGLLRQSPVAVVGAGDRSRAAPNEHAAQTTGRVGSGGGGGGGGLHPSLSRGLLWRSLHELRTPGWGEGTRIRAALDRVEQLTKVTAIIAIVSDLHEPGALASCKRLAQRHDVLVGQVQDPAETALRGTGLMRSAEAETGRGFIRTARAATGLDADVHTDLVGSGASHALIRTDRPLLAALRSLLQTRSAVQRGGR